MSAFQNMIYAQSAETCAGLSDHDHLKQMDVIYLRGDCTEQLNFDTHLIVRDRHSKH